MSNIVSVIFWFETKLSSYIDLSGRFILHSNCNVIVSVCVNCEKTVIRNTII